MKVFKLFILMFISIIAGIYLLVFPQDVSLWVIRGIGFWWCIEGVVYTLEIVLYYLEKDT